MDATPGASSPKRRRVDENPGDSFAEQVPLSDLKHSQEFWYGDGSVVLVCEDTGFRVHKSTMSTHSSVFRDLFSQGHMLADEKVDDCDVVRLPDRAYDFERLLRALYSRRFVFLSASLPESWFLTYSFCNSATCVKLRRSIYSSSNA